MILKAWHLDENETYCCALGHDFKYTTNDFCKAAGVDCYKSHNNSALLTYVHIYLYARLSLSVQNTVGLSNIEMLWAEWGLISLSVKYSSLEFLVKTHLGDLSFAPFFCKSRQINSCSKGIFVPSWDSMKLNELLSLIGNLIMNRVCSSCFITLSNNRSFMKTNRWIDGRNWFTH